MTAPGAQPFRLHRRTLPEQLRYLAQQLLAGADPGIVATGLEVIADEQAHPVAKSDTIRIRTDSGFEHQMRVVHVEQYMILLAESEENQ